ncbi:MAG: hypothetical protein QXX30_00945 [Candidatus Aenigmatarchaeota archaeon]
MCGIIAFPKKTKLDKKTIGVIENGLKLLAHRGSDSFGIIGIAKINNKKVLKLVKSLHFENFINMIKSSLINVEFDFIVIHNRKKSIGKIDIELAHPVGKNDIYVVQNGTKKSLSINEKSDTYGIYVLYKAEELKPEDLKNSGVVFIIDGKNKKILFHKDDTRTLYINETKNLIASEPILAGKWTLIGNNELDTFDIENIKLTNFEYEIKDINKEICDYCLKEGVIIEKRGKICKCANCYNREKTLEEILKEKSKGKKHKNHPLVEYSKNGIFYYEDFEDFEDKNINYKTGIIYPDFTE